MDLTVVIAVKNRPTNIGFCLKSIHESKFVPKVLVVDFGSTLPITTNFFNVEIIRVDRSTEFFHKARALNIGIRGVNTKYTCITDADQIFQPNFFYTVRSALEEKKVFVMCKTHFLSTPISNTFLEKPLEYFSILKSAKDQQGKVHGEGCCNAVTTAWLNAVRGYDERYIGFGAEDSDLMYRAKYAGLKRIWLEDKTSMIHLPHDKTGVYYDQSMFDKNKKLFDELKKTKKVVVNCDDWGQI